MSKEQEGSNIEYILYLQAKLERQRIYYRGFERWYDLTFKKEPQAKILK